MVDQYRAFITKVHDLKADVTNSLEFVEWKQHVAKNCTVFIKPNFTFPCYKEGVTTNPEVLRILIEQLLTRADRVIIGESDGARRSFTADQAFTGHGMHQICKDTGSELVNLSNIPAETVEEVIQGKKVKVQLPTMLLNDVDCFMSVPALKVHANTTVTVSMKNLWGCHPDSMRCLQHKYLSRKLTLITKSLNPQLILIDGTYALDGHGPMYGTPIKADLILSANNPVVADSLGSAVMGIPVSDVDHIMVAEREGLGITDLQNVEMNQDWKKFAMKFHVNKTVIDNMSWFLFNSELCAKIVMDSPMTSAFYKIVGNLRNDDEQKVADQMKK